MASTSLEIVVGIDFGTTHSGVSWAVNGGARTVRLIDTWPNSFANSNTPKVPSTICYKDGKVHKWGYKVDPKDDAFKWFKILLEPNHRFSKQSSPVIESNKLLVGLDKTAVGVVADYLTEIWRFALQDIRRIQGEDFESVYELRIVLTVPAMWSDAAMQRTLEAAREAGLPSKNIVLVSEPEAAALATLKDRAELNNLKIGDAFVVCDAGGGTVDLISYEVVGVRPLKIKECVIGEGGLCGSVFVDLGFESHVRTLVGEQEYEAIQPKYKHTMMRDFEWTVKKQHRSADVNQTYAIELRGLKEDKPPDIVDDNIILKAPALNTIFDHVCLKIENLVGDQIEKVKEKQLPIKGILLVGGFGESTYLHDRLKHCHKSHGINVFQTNQAWSAICRGATMWGLENLDRFEGANRRTSFSQPVQEKTTVSRLARSSYGLAFSVPFDSSKHMFSDRFRDPVTGNWRVTQMEWLIRRGEEIADGKVVSTECFAHVQVGFRDALGDGVHEFEQILYYCSAEQPPLRKTDAVKPLCKVNWAIPNTKLWFEKGFKAANKQKVRTAEMLLLMILGSAKLDYFVGYRNEPVGHAEVKYVD